MVDKFKNKLKGVKLHTRLRKKFRGRHTKGRDPESDIILNINSKDSIIHIGSLDSFDITEGGRKAAGIILDFLDNGDAKKLTKAIDIYDRIIPNENFGGEYTALEWICKLLIAPDKAKKRFLSQPLVASWFDMLAKDDFANLREYLQRKYHFIETGKDDPEANLKLRFLEDFMLFNNPDRERWDKIGENIHELGIQKGFNVIDFGCGPGYFTFKFADIVGEDGHVYGVEINEQHINYVKDYIKEQNITNVDVFQYQPDGLGIKSPKDNPIKADALFMCSLYHILYATLTDGERDLFINSIKRYLKDDGRLIIVDNDLVESEELPYHGPYISRELIISQLWHYGFELFYEYQFTEQRYILEFRLSQEPHKIEDESISIPAMFTDENSNAIKVTGPSSLIRYRMIGSQSKGFTLLGKKAAKLFYKALDKKDKDAYETALKTYEDLIPKERIGDEYTAFVWFCKYFLATDEQKSRMLSDKFDAEYYNYLADNDFALLKKYVRIMYDLDQPDPEMPSEDDEFALKRIHDVVYEYSGSEVSFNQLNDWSELVAFNNPNRESWEKTSEMLNYLNIKPGRYVADAGCGFGFFSFKFSEMVGEDGKVYSTEINTDALNYVKKIKDKYDLNIETVESKLNDICLPQDSVDTIFMCSMYHAVYIGSLETVKDQFIDSLKLALKEGGRLIIVDNGITPPSVVPYVGSGIAKELVIAQLKYYGFKLVDSKQFVPQRYILIFQQE